MSATVPKFKYFILGTEYITELGSTVSWDVTPCSPIACRNLLPLFLGQRRTTAQVLSKYC
jgi:hypothetical protein